MKTTVELYNLKSEKTVQAMGSTSLNILKEGNRIIRDNGLFVHMIDYRDHFSYSDKSISSINFLQFSNSEWGKYANNRYMYMNRLRHDDYLGLFESAGQYILKSQPNTDQYLYKILTSGDLKLDKKFSSKSKDILTVNEAWFVSQKYG
ncbi:MAG: hypothetical protein HN601_05355 [Candidatus Marinimicrobia bacterium]|nr:hypothetical protein [Candidatus Neomarinimicrobiota bacterium]